MHANDLQAIGLTTVQFKHVQIEGFGDPWVHMKLHQASGTRSTMMLDKTLSCIYVHLSERPKLAALA